MNKAPISKAPFIIVLLLVPCNINCILVGLYGDADFSFYWLTVILNSIFTINLPPIL